MHGSREILIPMGGGATEFYHCPCSFKKVLSVDDPSYKALTHVKMRYNCSTSAQASSGCLYGMVTRMIAVEAGPDDSYPPVQAA